MVSSSGHSQLSNRRFLVSGRVQGVGFRHATRLRAERLGLTGWVRNLASGDVEVEARGSADSLQEFARWLQQGPRYAEVRRVTPLQCGDRSFDSFRVLR